LAGPASRGRPHYRLVTTLDRRKKNSTPAQRKLGPISTIREWGDRKTSYLEKLKIGDHLWVGRSWLGAAGDPPPGIAQEVYGPVDHLPRALRNRPSPGPGPTLGPFPDNQPPDRTELSNRRPLHAAPAGTKVPFHGPPQNEFAQTTTIDPDRARNSEGWPPSQPPPNRAPAEFTLQRPPSSSKTPAHLPKHRAQKGPHRTPQPNYTNGPITIENPSDGLEPKPQPTPR